MRENVNNDFYDWVSSDPVAKLRSEQRSEVMIAHPTCKKLALRVRNKNATWVYRDSSSGKQSKRTLGDFDKMTLAEAEIAVSGQGAWTFARAVKSYVDHGIGVRGQRLSSKTKTIITRHGKLYFSQWQMPITDIDPKAYRDWLMEIDETRPGTSTHLHSWTGTLVRHIAYMTGEDIPNPARMTNRRSLGSEGNTDMRIKQLTEKQMDALRSVCLRGDDMKFSESATGRRAILWIMETGCRHNEALQCEWSDIDLEHGVWTIPASKSKGKRMQVKHLRLPALELLRHELSYNEDRVGYVFPNSRLHPTDKKKKLDSAWSKVRKETGLDCRLHDLRHSWAMWRVEDGWSGVELQRELGHSSLSTTEIYLRHRRIAPPHNLNGRTVAS